MRYIFISLMFIGCAAQSSGVGYCGLRVESSEMDEIPMLIDINSFTVNKVDQTINIMGEVRDSVLRVDSQLAGAIAMVKGKDVGTYADIDGVFHLYNLSVNDTLLFMYIGYHNKEIPVRDISNKKGTPQRIF